MAENNISLSSVIFRLLTYVWSSEWHIRLRIIISLFLTISMMVLRLGITFIYKHVINILSEPHSFAPWLMTFVLIGYGACWLLDYFATQLRALLIFRVLERSLRVISLTIVNHLLFLSLRFHIDRHTGALTNYIYRLQNGFDTVFWGVFTFLIPTCIEMSLVIILICYMYGWVYSNALIGIVLGYALLNIFGMAKSVAVQEIHNEKRAYASARIVDSLLNFETIKYFNNEKHELEQVNTALEQQEHAGIRRSATDVYLQLAQATVIGLGFIYLTWMSGQAVAAGKMTLGDFVLINGLLMQFIMPLNHFGSLMYQIRKGLHDIHSTFNILFLKPEVEDSPYAVHLMPNQAEVVFDHVHFGYAANRPILKDISFVIPAGKTIAIVGSTGSGKSTIARLIFRFYDIQSGSIKMNGQDIRNLSQRSLHQAVGIVPQDTVLFNDTLYYNIAYGNPKASKEDVEKAISLARLESFIHSLPDGHQTKVGERGLKLSGGEKQRVAIARVLLKKPSLFIFDEATSSLDTITEREIQKNLDEISSGTSTIIIAHRLSTVVQADEILVLDAGIIVEKGKHSELLLKNGLYAQLWREQQDKSPVFTNAID